MTALVEPALVLTCVAALVTFPPDFGRAKVRPAASQIEAMLLTIRQEFFGIAIMAAAVTGAATAIGASPGLAMSPAPAIVVTPIPEPAFRDRSVARVHALPGLGTSTRPPLPRAGRTRCIGVDNVAGAVVFGDRAVELTMKDGARWRMVFAQSCPALSFYQGFYYRRAVAGRLCAGRDAVIARSGGECQIGGINLVRKPSRRG